MVKIKSVITFSCLFMIIIGCENKNSLKNFNRLYPRYDIDNFEVDEIVETSYDKTYYLTNSDSSEFLTLVCLINNKPGSENIYFECFHKRIIEDNQILIESYDKDRSLKWSFMHKHPTSFHADEDAFFVRGMYYYCYTKYKYKLNKKQLDYFKVWQDSIIKNGVNEIPIFDNDSIVGFSKDFFRF